MSKYKEKNIHIIRAKGQPNKAQLPDGSWVERLDKVFIPNYGGFIPVAGYLEHFIYEQSRYLGPRYRCTCGAFAIIVGVSGYIHDASPQGKMMVCEAHSVTGKHQFGGDRWV